MLNLSGLYTNTYVVVLFVAPKTSDEFSESSQLQVQSTRVRLSSKRVTRELNTQAHSDVTIYWTIQGKVRSRRRADTRPGPTDQCAKSPYKKEPEITILLNNRRRSFCELLGFSQTWWLPHFYVVETGRSGARINARFTVPLPSRIIISCSISWATVSVSISPIGVEGRRETQEIYGGHRQDTHYRYNRIAHAQIYTWYITCM